MSLIHQVVNSAPEVFLFIAIAGGTLLGRVRIGGFALGAMASTLLVAVLLGQLGNFAIPGLIKAILFGLFVFTIGFQSGPQFFASLSLRTLAQVALAVVISATGLGIVLASAFWLHLSPGTAAGLAAGSLTQSSIMGTAAGALASLGLPETTLAAEQANVAAGYAVTYVCGYILVLIFVPLIAPKLMGVDLKSEAAKLEESLSAGTTNEKRPVSSCTEGFRRGPSKWEPLPAAQSPT